MNSFRCLTSDLKDFLGFYIAKEVVCADTGRLLLNVNVIVDDNIITSLQKHGVVEVFVSRTKIEDLVTQEPNERAFEFVEVKRVKKLLTNTFSDVVNDISHQVRFKKFDTRVSPEMMKKINDTVESLISQVMKSDAACTYLSLVDENDAYFLKHSVNVTFLTVNMFMRYRDIVNVFRDNEKGIRRFHALGTTCNPDDAVALGTSCFLHDIGKVLILSLVNKDVKYDASNDAEVIKKIREHPLLGYKILFGKNMNSHALLGIKYHHENFDGSGYPYGIGGYKIHPYARLIRIVDSFDAATSDRPGRGAKALDEIVDEMLAGAKKQYDPEFLRVFLEMVNR